MKKTFAELHEGESRKDALKRAAAIAKWKKAGGKVEKQPPTPGKGDEKMAKAVQDYKKKMKKKGNEIGAGNFWKKEVERMRISMLKKDTKKLVILWILHKV